MLVGMGEILVMLLDNLVIASSVKMWSVSTANAYHFQLSSF